MFKAKDHRLVGHTAVGPGFGTDLEKEPAVFILPPEKACATTSATAKAKHSDRTNYPPERSLRREQPQR